MITIANSRGNWSEALKVVINYKDGLIPVQMLGSRSGQFRNPFYCNNIQVGTFLIGINDIQLLNA